MIDAEELRIARLVDRATPVVRHRLDIIDELPRSYRDEVSTVDGWSPDRVRDEVTRCGSFHYTPTTRQTYGLRWRAGYAVGSSAPPFFLVVPEEAYADLTRTRKRWRVVVHAFARYAPTDLDEHLLSLTGRFHLYGAFRVDSEWHDCDLHPIPDTGNGAPAAARRLAWRTARALADQIDTYATARWHP